MRSALMQFATGRRILQQMYYDTGASWSQGFLGFPAIAEKLFQEYGPQLYKAALKLFAVFLTEFKKFSLQIARCSHHRVS